MHSPARSKAATLALAATIFLSAIKLVVAVISGSIGVLSEAIHSGLDLLSSLMTFFVVRASVRPADWDHPFGHGKLENLSALFEAFLLMVAAGYILYEVILRWNGAYELHHLGWALIVTGVSVVVNLYVYLQNRAVAKAEESIAIETNAYHFLTDIFSSLAVFIGLVVIQLTSWMFIDALLALFIAVYIFWVAVVQMRKSIAELSDTALPQHEMTLIQDSIDGHQQQFLNFHDLRTRKAGASRYIDFHLTVCSELRVHQAHSVCDRIEQDLMKHFKHIHVNIHVEPCGNHGPECKDVCKFLNIARNQQ